MKRSILHLELDVTLPVASDVEAEQVFFNEGELEFHVYHKGVRIPAEDVIAWFAGDVTVLGEDN